MMKKLVIAIGFIILGVLGYAAYQHYSMQQSDNVEIQGNEQNGYFCEKDSDCQSNKCGQKNPLEPSQCFK